MPYYGGTAKPYLGIDVGLHTGVGLLHEDGSVLAYFIVKHDDAGSWRPLLTLARTKDDLNVCIEYPVTSIISNTRELQAVVDRVRALFPDAFIVRPGVWKLSAIANQPLPENVQGTRLPIHIKDGINIARWFRQQVLEGREQ